MIIDLICDKQHFLPRSAKHLCDLAIERMNAAGDIDNKKNDSSLRNGDLCLATYLPLENILRIGDDSSGIDDKEITSGPIGASIDPVASNSGNRFSNSHPLTDQAVEESRFTNVW